MSLPKVIYTVLLVALVATSVGCSLTGGRNTQSSHEKVNHEEVEAVLQTISNANRFYHMDEGVNANGIDILIDKGYFSIDTDYLRGLNVFFEDAGDVFKVIAVSTDDYQYGSGYTFQYDGASGEFVVSETPDP